AAALPPRQVQTFRGRLGVTIPLSRPPVDDEVKEAVLAAIEGRQYILGPQCKEFESELARHAGVKHAVLTSSATAALWMIMRGLGRPSRGELRRGRGALVLSVEEPARHGRRRRRAHERRQSRRALSASA